MDKPTRKRALEKIKKGLLSVEEETVQIAWNDAETGVFIAVCGEKTEIDLMQTLANGVILEK